MKSKERKIKNLLCLFSVALTLTTVSCSKDDGPGEDIVTLKEKEITLIEGDTYQIEATSRGALAYSVEGKTYAEVSKDGLVTANCFGENKIRVSNGATSDYLKVTVLPNGAPYTEPDVAFGDKQTSVVTKLGKSDAETPFDDKANCATAAYKTKNDKIETVFNFTKTGLLFKYSVTIQTNTVAPILALLNEKYPKSLKTQPVSDVCFYNAANEADATIKITLSQPSADDLVVITYECISTVTLKEKNVALTVGDTYQIELEKQDAALTYTYTISSYYGSITKTGLLTAERFGKTKIYVTNGVSTDSADVTIIHKEDSYVDPDIKFCESKDDVIARLGEPRRYFPVDSTSTKPWMYYDYSKQSTLFVYLDVNENVEDYWFSVETNDSEPIFKFLDEKYPLKEKYENEWIIEDYEFYYHYYNASTKEDATMCIWFYKSKTSSYFSVHYFPYSSNKSVQSDDMRRQREMQEYMMQQNRR